MATSGNDNDNDSGHSSNQGRDDDDRHVSVSGKPKKSKRDGTAAKKGVSRRSDNNNSNGSNIEKSKRRRRNKPNNPRCIIIPEARVIQEYNEHAYISEHEEDEREYLPPAVRRRSGHEVAYGLRQESRHQVEVEVKNDASALSKVTYGHGRKHNARSRCHCFDCW